MIDFAALTEEVEKIAPLEDQPKGGRPLHLAAEKDREQRCPVGAGTALGWRARPQGAARKPRQHWRCEQQKRPTENG